MSTYNAKRELYRLTGNDDYTTGVPARYLTLANEPDTPSADEITEGQIQEAIQRIHEDTRGYPRFPWRALAKVSGPMCPEDLIIVAARTGGGKSLFLQNLWDALICEGRFGLYIGLEQSPSELRIKWSCLRQDVPPKLVLAPDPDEDQGSPQWHTAMRLVQEDFQWQRTSEIRRRAHFAPVRRINAAGLEKCVQWGLDHGAEFVMVDHIDRIDHGAGKNSFHEVSETVRTAKELASKNRIVMIVASQVGRPEDKLAQFMPPTLHDLRGAGTKEEEANTVLGVYRPLRANVTEQELKQARQGLCDRDAIIEPGVMAVQVLKHRLDGPMAGKVVKLAVKHQRVSDMPEKDRWTTDGGYARQVV